MKKLLLFALLLNAALLAGRLWQELPVDAQEQPVATENGDLDGDGTRSVTDAVYLLRWLFQGDWLRNQTSRRETRHGGTLALGEPAEILFRRRSTSASLATALVFAMRSPRKSF